MITGFTKKGVSIVLSLALVTTSAPFEAIGQSQSLTGSNEYEGQGTPFSAQELQQLAAPIALFPDSLVAQVLGGATFPDQVAGAQTWLEQNKNLSSATLTQSVNAQSWDPSVKALTQFPSVLENMAKNLSWTSALGEAYHTQAPDVMTAIQVLRAQAKAAGNLKSGSQITVAQQSAQVIVIQPTDPQVVYVPEYNPAVVYGAAYVTPGYSTAAAVATGMLAFGTGIVIGAAMSGGCCGWGYSYWNCNWHSGAVAYGGTTYYGNNAWHGGFYGSSATAYGPEGSARVSTGYNPSTGTYARGASAATPYGTQRAGQAYNPYTGAYGATRQVSNASGSYGDSVVSKNGETAYTQHESNASGSAGSIQTSNGGKAVAGSGVNGSGTAAETSNGDKYAAANGNVYKNTGNGWQQTEGKPHGSTTSYSGPSSASSDARGWGQQDRSGGSSAFGGDRGGSGWQSRAESSRGWASRGGRR